MKRQEWLKEVNDNIQKGKTNLSEKDIRFFHVERLQKIAGLIESNSAVCADCMKMKIPVLELSANLNLYIHGNFKDRVYYERILDRAVKHLKVTWYISFISFQLPVLLHWVHCRFWFWNNHLSIFIEFIEAKFILILALVGILTGQFAGRKKDNIVRREGRKL
jgi:hypothetical protein